MFQNRNRVEGEAVAITKLMHIKAREKGDPSAGLKNAIDYITNPEKTKNGKLVGTLNCTKEHAYEKMLLTKELYGKEDERQGYHFVISFNPGEVTPEKAFQITDEFCRAFIGTKYECVYSVHDDKDHMHGHIVFNSVSVEDGRKYHYENGDWKKTIQPITNRICEKYGLETIDVNEKGMADDFDDFGKWEGNKKEVRLTNQEELKALIDNLIPDCKDIEELKERLQEAGCRVRDGKYLSVRIPEAERGIRTYRLGHAYEKESLIKRIAGEALSAPHIQSQSQKLKQESYKVSRGGYKGSKKQSMHKSEYWKYKDDAAKLRMINRQNQYLSENRFSSVHQLEMRKAVIGKRKEEIDKLRYGLFTQRKQFQDAIELIKMMPKEAAEKGLREKGYDPDSIYAFESATREELENLRIEKRNLRGEENLINSIERKQRSERKLL